MIRHIILMLSILLIGCFGEKSSNTSTVSESWTDSINPKIDRNNLYKPYTLYKDENSDAKLVVKQPQYSISKGDTVNYEIFNLDNYELMVGYQFALEYWDGYEWKDIPHGLPSVDIGLLIKKDSHLTFEFNLSEVERSFLKHDKSALLKQGKYRIIKSVDVTREKRAPQKEIFLFAEFLLIE